MRARTVPAVLLGLLVGSRARAEEARAVVQTFPAPHSAGAVQMSGLSFDEIWFPQPNANSLARVNADGSLTERSLPAGAQPLAISRYVFDGLLTFTEPGTNRIATLTPSGALTEYDVPTSASSPRGVARPILGNLVWFSEYDGNRIGRFEIGNPGSITEFPIPTFASGPLGIAEGPGPGSGTEIWFTENLANKIGRIDANGVITEVPIPTPDSGPTAITWGSGGLENSMLFTETRGNRIGRITPAGVITERPIPTPNSGPSDIVPDVFTSQGGVWFTERTVGQIGWMSPEGRFREFKLPGGSRPESLALDYGTGHFGPARVWYLDSTKRVVGRLSDNHLFAVGAANSARLDTEFEVTNQADESVKVRFGWPFSGICPGICPITFLDVSLLPMRTAEIDASTVPGSFDSRFMAVSGIEPEISDVPETEAWVIDAARPDQRIRLPLVSYWEIASVQGPSGAGRPKPDLEFPARRRNRVRTSLILAGIESEVPGGQIPLEIEAVELDGEIVASMEVDAVPGQALVLSRVLSDLGIFENFEGHLRVTRLSRAGYFWGVVEIYEGEILTRLMPPGSELEPPACTGSPRCNPRSTRVVTRDPP